LIIGIVKLCNYFEFRASDFDFFTMERLQKILSRAGIASRRHAEELILSGKVQVNNRVVRELGSKADVQTDTITVEGKPLHPQQSYHYYAYYKPRGVLVSKKDKLGRKTIFDLLKLPSEVNSVGRLDKDSEGLLLLTDDGDLLQKFTHPSFEVSKIYHVQISRKMQHEEKKRLLQGVLLEGKRVHAVRIRALPQVEGFWIEMELREGIKREIRRMLELFEIRVIRLIRIQHGSVTLGSLQPGEIVCLAKAPQ
jgi:23S rRNA pseudouridine2605 synthase